MNSPSNLSKSDHGVVADSLQAELDQVMAKLHTASAALQTPLNEFVASQISANQPYCHALVVLASGAAEDDSAQLREGRILLASALELLYVAHCIHKNLLRDDNRDLDKSLMGSLILAGDYCFSQAAMLAAQTTRPAVVRIFSQTLKDISEGNLRTILEEGVDFDEHALLFEAGIQAAGVLTGASASETAALGLLADDLINRLNGARAHKSVETRCAPDAHDRKKSLLEKSPPEESLPTAIRLRWKIVLERVG